MFKKLSAPISVQWELTSWCSYNCIHCYNYWRRNKPPNRYLSTSELRIHKKASEEIIKNRVFNVTLTGGEPLGVITQLTPELKEISKNKINFTINSNLALMTEEIGDIFSEINIKSILTSLISSDQKINDELAQQDGAYERTINGILLAKALGFSVSINMVVTQQNFHTIYETGKLAFELGASRFSATKAAKPTNCPDFNNYSISFEQLQQMFIELVRINKDFGINIDSIEHYPGCAFPNNETRTIFGSRNCSAGKTGATIGFDGGIRPCGHAPMSYGNIAIEGLKKSWENMECWRNDELIPDFCKNECGEYPNLCGGGCRIEALNAVKELNGVDPYCLQIKPSTRKMQTKVKPLSAENKVILHKDTVFRKEDFGFIAFRLSNDKWLPVDNLLYNILNSPTHITAYNIAEAYSSPLENALETLSTLKHYGLVDFYKE
jgi:radical SAM protein with 4Fe4S-binding SPASM domain